jgi:hypothetical protein
MYETPRIDKVGTVRGLTLDGENCFYGKTVVQDRDLLGYFADFPIGDCATS